MTKVYCGIDLHSNNCVVVVMDGTGKVLYQRRLENDLERVLLALAPYREQLSAVAVESTFNWYWLVDGLMEAGHSVRLVNTGAIQQYRGLKHSDDTSDATWLAEMLRLGILPTGYIYPKGERAVRDLLRKRTHLVQQRTANILSIQNLVRRNSGSGMKSNAVKALKPEATTQLFANEDVALAVATTVRVRQCLDTEIAALEKVVLGRVQLRPEFVKLKTIPGVGDILSLTIMLETGEIGRFPSVGNFSSYCRCVNSTRLSNGKKKGEGNVKNGNGYLAWAFVEAANFALRYSSPIQRFHQRKAARTKKGVATKAVAHKLARAAYYVLRDQVAFDVSKAFC